MEPVAPNSEDRIIASENYVGREQALVKHTFLSRYLRDGLPKLSRFGSFAYVDLFAGPWEERSADCSDTSFGIALRRMREAKRQQQAIGRDVRMVAHLVSYERYDDLSAAVAPFRSDLEITCYQGKAEDHCHAISNAIKSVGFRFVMFDPKGLPNIKHLKSLLEQKNTEFLLNFMFQFANRFLDRMPALETWLGELESEENWLQDTRGLTAYDRETYITDRARAFIAKLGQFEFAPALTVDETGSDRALYKLIYLTRSRYGLKVFREACLAALQMQAFSRSQIKTQKRASKTGMNDLFADEQTIDPGERSAKIIANAQVIAKARLLDLVVDSGATGVAWVDVWRVVLDEIAITHSQLGHITNELRLSGRISIPSWPNERTKIPKDEFRLFAAN